MRIQAFFTNLLASLTFGSSMPAENASHPTVILDDAMVIGKANGTVSQFFGIPFAQPPVGGLRLRLPKPVSPYHGTINATTYGNQCIQQTIPPIPFPEGVPAAVGEFLASFSQGPKVPQSEDCLNLNVIVPAGTPPDSKLPVAVWIYGGGFQIGHNSGLPGDVVVTRSIEMGEPIIYVAINYRLSAFGFLGGREVKDAGVGNLGLHDQREALRWIQKYISAFGGDPTKVMIWGQSAGSISVALQMLANGGDTEGLFRAGFMQSGTLVPTGYVNNPYLQSTYDAIVNDTGCSTSNNTLNCLRTVDAESIQTAMNKGSAVLAGFKQLNLAAFPRADGVFLSEPSEHQLLAGNIARIPVIVGSNGDEGTLFSFPTANLTTDGEFRDYVQHNYFGNTSDAAISKLLELYPADPAAGSPYGTGDAFAYSPQYKRMSALQGDLFFTAPTRLFVQELSKQSPVYSYLYRMDQVEGLGAAHGTEMANVYGGGSMTDYLIRFAATLDPNGDDAFHWPQYTQRDPQLLTFNDDQPQFSLTPNTYRAAQMAYLTKLSLTNPM
ncbi:carotenoid ester lipase [Daedaleopsis nitida]|nr:carotenoid ester lipase [Daedaleopsis nitida]